MKIKKTFQGTVPENKILNSDSSNQTDTYSCDYINDVSVVVSPTEPTGTNRKKIWMQKGKNLFDKSKISKSFRLGTDGNVAADIECFISDYIEVMPNTTYTINIDEITYQKRIAEFREDKTAISLITTTTFTTGSETKYIRFTNLLDTEDTFQVEQNQTATEKEEYIEPKIFIKNGNDVYEEFMKKHEEIYSTEEQVIGTWKDGKALYRKVIEYKTTETIGSANAVTNIPISHNISNLDRIVKHSMLDSADTIYPLISVNSNLTQMAKINYYNSTMINFRLINTTLTARTFYITLEYTKT